MSERERLRALLIVAIQALSDGLYKESRMGDNDEMALRCLRAGAESAIHILEPEPSV